MDRGLRGSRDEIKLFSSIKYVALFQGEGNLFLPVGRK